MERVNPETGQPFRYGDKCFRKNQLMRFMGYLHQRIKKDGTKEEKWASEEVYLLQNGPTKGKTKIISMMLSGARRRAREKDVPFTLTPAYLRKFDVFRCSVTGVALECAATPTAKFLSPSLDRIIPALGYVEGNIRIVAHGVNQCKGEAMESDPRYVDLVEKYAIALRNKRDIENQCIEMQCE